MNHTVVMQFIWNIAKLICNNKADRVHELVNGARYIKQFERCAVIIIIRIAIFNKCPSMSNINLPKKRDLFLARSSKDGVATNSLVLM